MLPSDETFSDVLGEDPDPRMLQFGRSLSSAFRVHLPPDRDAATEKALAAASAAGVVPARRLFSWGRVSLAAVLFLASGGIALALTNLTDLGRPTSDVPQFVPLGGFLHRGPNLKQHGLPELLFIGTQVDGYSGAERWPVVKALDQFGSFSGISGYVAPACTYDPYGEHCPHGSLAQRVCTKDDTACGVPTLNWERARYRSRYVVFVHKDLIDQDGAFRQHLSPVEMTLFQKYVEIRKGGFQPSVWATVANPSYNSPGMPGNSPRHFPLVTVGGYLQAGTDTTVPGDFRPNIIYGEPPLSVSAIQHSLVTDKATGGAPSALPYDVNSEANTITALICHADGGKPRSVCRRPAIRKLLRHVR